MDLLEVLLLACQPGHLSFRSLRDGGTQTLAKSDGGSGCCCCSETTSFCTCKNCSVLDQIIWPVGWTRTLRSKKTCLLILNKSVAERKLSHGCPDSQIMGPLNFTPPQHLRCLVPLRNQRFLEFSIGAQGVEPIWSCSRPVQISIHPCW